MHLRLTLLIALALFVAGPSSALALCSAQQAGTYPNCTATCASPCDMPEGQADFCAIGNTVNDQKTACESMSGGTILTSEASTAGGMNCAANRTPCQVDGTNFCANGGPSACQAGNGEVITAANPNPDPAPTPNADPDPAPGADPDEDTTTTGGATQEGALLNPLGVTSIEDLLAKVLEGVVTIGSILLVLALVWVGFLFVFAQGKEESIRSARQALFWTIIGGILLLGAEAISLVLKATVQNL